MPKIWIRWTLAESGTRSLSTVLQKVVGMVSASVAETIFVTLVIGLVQVIGASLVNKIRKKRLLVHWTLILGSVIFGIFAVAATVLGFVAFLYGAELGARTFIISLSIFVGALIDAAFFVKG